MSLYHPFNPGLHLQVPNSEPHLFAQISCPRFLVLTNPKQNPAVQLITSPSGTPPRDHRRWRPRPRSPERWTSPPRAARSSLPRRSETRAAHSLDEATRRAGEGDCPWQLGMLRQALLKVAIVKNGSVGNIPILSQTDVQFGTTLGDFFLDFG